MRQILALVRKELLLFLADRRAVVIGIVTPILLASFFGFLFSGTNQSEAAKIPIRVVDQDGSLVSRAVASALGGDPLLDVTPAEADAARTAVRRGQAAVAAILPRNFGHDAVRAFYGAAAPPEVVLLVDPSRAIEAGLVRGLLAEKVFREASREAFGGAGGQEVVREARREIEQAPGPADEQRTALLELLGDLERWHRVTPAPSAPGEPPATATPAPRGPGSAVPFVVREEGVTARKGAAYNSYAHSFAGMGIQFLLFVALDFGIALLLERQSGLWKRLRAAPLSRGTLLFGKTIAGALIGLISVGATFAFGIVVLAHPEHDDA